jgi:hypothetical protein
LTVSLPQIPEGSLIYYVGVGDRIKIGKSGAANLGARMSMLRAEVLLAVEPAGELTERQRHDQFSHARLTGEWFEPTSDLLAFIDSLPVYDLPPAPRPRLTGAKARNLTQGPR